MRGMTRPLDRGVHRADSGANRLRAAKISRQFEGGEYSRQLLMAGERSDRLAPNPRPDRPPPPSRQRDVGLRRNGLRPEMFAAKRRPLAPKRATENGASWRSASGVEGA